MAIVKELREINAQMDQAELKLKIAELTSVLADAKLGLVDATSEIDDRDREISKLKDALRYIEEETIEHKTYRYPKKNGVPYGLPFCPACLDDGRFARMVNSNTPGRPKVCPRCKADYANDPTHFAE